MFKDIIAKLDSCKNLEIIDQAFSNEIVFDQDLSMSFFCDLKFENFNFGKVNFSGSCFRDCEFENCRFEKIVMRKSEFTECTFQNCKFLESSLSKVEFDNTSFKACQFSRVNLGWSCWLDSAFIETEFEQVDLEGATLSNLKIKDSLFLNLNFTDSFPTKFYKSNLNEFIEIKSQLNFEKILKEIECKD